MQNKIKKIVIAALFAGLVFCTTFFFQIPFVAGYVHLGDCMVISAGLVLGPVYGTLAAGLGSFLSDLIGGYAQYMFPTFIIKSLMALAAWCIFRFVGRSKLTMPCIMLSGVISAVIMVAGYYITEVILVGSLAGGVASLVPNAIQGVFGVVSSALLIKLISKNKFLREYLRVNEKR